MLTTSDRDRLLRAIRESSLPECEFYGEQNEIWEAELSGRVEQVRQTSDGGLNLTYGDGGRTRASRTTPNSTVDSALALLRGRTPTGHQPTVSTSVPAVRREEKFGAISQLFKTLLSESAFGDCLRVRYRDHFKDYFVLNDRGVSASAHEQSAELFINWQQETSSGTKAYSLRKSRMSVDGLLAEISNPEGLRTRALEIQSEATPWPSPAGEFPILWSSAVFSELCLYLLRAFEGDLFLNSHSFLAHIKAPFSFKFDLQESPSLQVTSDHEGSARKKISLIVEGLPKGLACNRWVAEQLSVPPTGHSRRESYLRPPTVGFWNPMVVPKNQEKNLIAACHNGLLIEAIEVLSYNPKSADIWLRLSEPYLVQHGERGDRVNPIELHTNLLDLLSSCETFAAAPDSHAFPLQKRGTRFLTEITTPAVLTRPIRVDGEVPASTYW